MCIISNPSPLRVIAQKDEDALFSTDEVSSIICPAIRDLGKQKKNKDENCRLVCKALSHADLKHLSNEQRNALKTELFSLNAFKGSEKGLQILAALMEGGASKELIDELIRCFSAESLNGFRTATGQTFLHLAVKGNYFDFAKKLIENGIDARVVDNDQQSSAMFFAAYLPDDAEKFFALFLEKGIQLDQANNMGMTPLERIGMDQPQLVARLLGKPDVVVPDNMADIRNLFFEGDGAVILAGLQEKLGIASWNDRDVLQKLNSFQDRQGNTLLHFAMDAPLEVMEKLLRAGMDPKKANILGQTPLSLASYRNIPQAKLIFDKGGDFLAKDATGRTVWEILIAKGDLDTAASLLAVCEPISQEAIKNLTSKIRSLIKLETETYNKRPDPKAFAAGYVKQVLRCMRILELCGKESISDSSKESFAFICFEAHRKYNLSEEARFTPEELEQFQKIEDAVLERVLLGHMNKAENSEDFRYEGLYRQDHSKMRTRIYDAIDNAPMLDEMDPVERGQLRDIIQKGKIKKTEAEILNGIRAGEFQSLDVGYDEHFCEAVFQGSYLVICNRGDRPRVGFFSKKPVPSIMAFKIDPSKMTPELLKSISNAKKDRATFVKLIYQDLPKLLSPTGKKAEKDGNCLAIEANPPKDQIVGNCSLTSFKTAVLVGFRLNAILNGDRAVPLTQRLDKTQKLFKKVWTFSRASLLELYSNSSYSHLDTDLEERALKKLKKHVSKHDLDADVILAPFQSVREGLRGLA